MSLLTHNRLAHEKHQTVHFHSGVPHGPSLASRGQLDKAQVREDLLVIVSVKADLLGVKSLSAVDVCDRDMLYPTNGNKPTRFYVSSTEKKRWHPSLLKHKELLF
jgi:hypothetical protein